MEPSRRRNRDLSDSTLSSAAGGVTIGVGDLVGAPGQAGVGTATASAGSMVTALITSLGLGSRDSGALALTGAGTNWSDVNTAGGPADAGSSYIGAEGVGTLTIEAGAAMDDALDGTLGYAAGASGTAIVEGSGTKWTIGNVLTVGDDGVGQITVEAGGELSAGSALIGNYAASDGALTIDASGVATIGGAMVVGAKTGATGAVTVDGAGASLTVGDDLIIGDDGVGAMSVTEGGSVATSNLGEVGAGGGAATVKVDGAGSNWTISDELILGVVGAATGPAMTISNGAIVDSETKFAASDDNIDDRSRSGSTLSITGGGEFDDVVFFNENNATLSLNDGAKMTLRGVESNDYGQSSFWADGTVTIDDSIVSAPAGGIAIGSDNAASSNGSGAVTVSNGATVNALITRLAWSFVQPTSYTGTGSLILTGAGTTWNDVATTGGPADSGTSYIGAVGTGTLTIEAVAQMKEADGGVVGYGFGSHGVATVEGAGSTWSIADDLIVGEYGQGQLTVEGGGQVFAAGASIGDFGELGNAECRRRRRGRRRWGARISANTRDRRAQRGQKLALQSACRA